tara:strand:+ start:178 stop:423 length:246 start_codon:yes stop_codon:yes gene_type:complete
MKARVIITLKSGVLDPQGQASQNTLHHLGFDSVGTVRQGKFIEIDLNESDETKAKEKVEAMCEQLLANTVIEKYDIELIAA